MIIELYTAITNNVPIVSLNVKKEFCEYDYAAAERFLMFFDKEIDIANPGAALLLHENNIDPVDVAYRLSVFLPYIISTNFNPHDNDLMIEASAALVDSMRSNSNQFKQEQRKKSGWKSARITDILLAGNCTVALILQRRPQVKILCRPVSIQ